MKSLFLLFVLVLFSFSKSFPQWSNDPNNHLIIGYGLDPHICSDSAGGCYITYDYESIYYPRKLAVERLDKYGYKPWGAKKQIQGELPEQWEAQITEDGEGGVIVSYIDRYENIPEWTQKLRVQRVDSSGNYLWGPTGVRVTLDEINHGLQYLVADDSGGCVVTWKTVNSIFYVNRISANGERLWSDSGKVLGISNYSGTEPRVIRAKDGSYYVETGEYIYRIKHNGEIVRRDSLTLGYIVPDPEGGIVLSGRVWTGMIPKLVAQRKDSLGNNLWQEPYVEIADSLDINTLLNIKYNNGYFYYSWTGKKNGINKVAQFQALRLDGSKLFSESIQIGKPPLNGTIVIPLEENRTAFIYYNKDFLPDSLLVQSYDTLGNKLWNENGILVAHPPIEYQSYTTDGTGGFIIGGVINNFTVVAQQVSKNGNLGEVIIPVELVSFTGIEKANIVTLNWVTATELNNYGFDVQRRKTSNGRGETMLDWVKIGFIYGNGTTTQSNTYSFIDKNITDGIYKYRLKQIDYDGSYEYSNEISVEVNYLPKEYLLYQNYPNPFNSSTTIKYALKNDGRVTLKIYNIIGEEVRTLVDEVKSAGSYQVNFNANELSNGVYIYKIQSNDFVNSKKMIFIK